MDAATGERQSCKMIVSSFAKVCKFYGSFCMENPIDINTKKTKIVGIPTEYLVEKTKKYCEKLKSKQKEIEELEIRDYRIKNDNSIRQKLETYVKIKEEKGEVEIKKCLNDLLGFRIISNISFEDFDTLKNEVDFFLSEEYPIEPKLNCRIIKREVPGEKTYRAIHIYVSDGVYSFPWEIQIWSAGDESENLAAHSLYKQEYAKWEQENKTLVLESKGGK